MKTRGVGSIFFRMLATPNLVAQLVIVLVPIDINLQKVYQAMGVKEAQMF
jgi:hypothetical protein